MMYGMPATYGLPGQVHGMPGQGPPLPNPGVGLAGQPPMAVPPQLAASVSSHPSMSSPEVHTFHTADISFRAPPTPLEQ